MLAYKVMESANPKHPVGTIFLVADWQGRNYNAERYDFATLSFTPEFRARYLGRVTARSERQKIRQLLALPGTSHIRRAQEEHRRRARG